MTFIVEIDLLLEIRQNHFVRKLYRPEKQTDIQTDRLLYLAH